MIVYDCPTVCFAEDETRDAKSRSVTQGVAQEPGSPHAPRILTIIVRVRIRKSTPLQLHARLETQPHNAGILPLAGVAQPMQD